MSSSGQQLSSQDSKCKGCLNKTINILSLLSLGKYSTKMYHRGEPSSSYTTLFASILTLIFSLTVIGLSISILVSVIIKRDYVMKGSSAPLNETAFADMTYG